MWIKFFEMKNNYTVFTWGTFESVNTNITKNIKTFLLYLNYKLFPKEVIFG